MRWFEGKGVGVRAVLWFVQNFTEAFYCKDKDTTFSGVNMIHKVQSKFENEKFLFSIYEIFSSKKYVQNEI